MKERVNRTKSGSVAGPDNIKRCHLKRRGVSEMLAILYNILLRENYYPEAWKINRTTLVPKAGKDARDVKNWIPITVRSMMG